MKNTPLNYYRYLTEEAGVEHENAVNMVHDATSMNEAGEVGMKKPEEIVESTLQELRDAGMDEVEIRLLENMAEAMAMSLMEEINERERR